MRVFNGESDTSFGRQITSKQKTGKESKGRGRERRVIGLFFLQRLKSVSERSGIRKRSQAWKDKEEILL